jgi:RHS repeat-associated protein
VFWKCGVGNGTGYAALSADPDPVDAVASLDLQPPGDSLACWLADRMGVDELAATGDGGSTIASPATLSSEPMLRLGSAADPTWAVFDLHTDHLGSVRVITDSSGYLVSAHNYFPFGGEITNTLSFNTHQYTGHERDKETGLDYMLARYYGDGLPRFVSADTLDGVTSDPQSWNRYTYVRNNPLRLVDPDGQKDVSAIDETTKIAIEAGAKSTAKYLARRFIGRAIDIPGIDFLFTANEAASSFQEFATIAQAHVIENALVSGLEDADNDAEAGLDAIRKIVQMFEVDPGRAKQMLDLFLRETNKSIKDKTKPKDSKSSSKRKNPKTGTDPDKTCADCIPSSVTGDAWVQDGEIHRGGA